MLQTWFVFILTHKPVAVASHVVTVENAPPVPPGTAMFMKYTLADELVEKILPVLLYAEFEANCTSTRTTVALPLVIRMAPPWWLWSHASTQVGRQ